MEKQFAVRLAFRGGDQAAGSLRGVGHAAGQATPAMRGLNSAVQGLQGHLLALVSVGAITALGHEAIETADKFAGMRNRLKLVVQENENLLKIEKDLTGVAMRNRADMEGTVALYSKVRSARKDLSDATAQHVVDAWNKSLVISGSNASEAASSTLQFAQAMGAGALRGAELNSVLAGNLRAAQLFADGLGIPLGQLKKMGEEGKITGDIIVNSLVGSMEKLQAEMDKMGLTVGQASNNLSTAWTRFIGLMDQATGFTEGLAEGVTQLADMLGGAEKATEKGGAKIKDYTEALAELRTEMEKTDDIVAKAGFARYAKSATDALPALDLFQKKIAAINTEMEKSGEAERNRAVGALSLSRGAMRDARSVDEFGLTELDRIMKEMTASGALTPGDEMSRNMTDMKAKLEKQIAASKVAEQDALDRIYELLKTPASLFKPPSEGGGDKTGESPLAKLIAETEKEWRDLADAAKTPIEQIRDKIDLLNLDVAEGRVTWDTYTAALRALNAEMAEATAKMNEHAVANEAVHREVILVQGSLDLLDDSLNSQIESWDDLGKVALRVLEDIARKAIEAQLAISKGAPGGGGSFWDFITGAFGQAIGGGFGGGGAPGGGNLGKPTGNVARHHSGYAPRLHSGWRGLAAHEMPAIIDDRERIFSANDNARLIRAIERGGAGGVTVNIYNEGGGQVEQRETRSPDGGRQLDIYIRRQAAAAIAGGDADAAMRARYGVAPQTRRVG